MKKLMAIGLGIFAAASIWAQGTVNFLTMNPIYDAGGSPALGAGWLADLYWAPAGPETLQPADSAFVSGNVVRSFTTAPPGYMNSGSVSLAGTTGGQQVWVQLRAWNSTDGATWQAAYTSGGLPHLSMDAPAIKITLGNPTGTPATPAASILGLPSHNLTVVPEPSTILLGLAGLGGLLFLRRRKA